MTTAFRSGCRMSDGQDKPRFIPGVKKMRLDREVEFRLKRDSHWGSHKSCWSFVLCKQTTIWDNGWLISSSLWSCFIKVQTGGSLQLDVCVLFNLTHVATAYVCKTELLKFTLLKKEKNNRALKTLKLDRPADHDADASDAQEIWQDASETKSRDVAFMILPWSSGKLGLQLTSLLSLSSSLSLVQPISLCDAETQSVSYDTNCFHFKAQSDVIYCTAAADMEGDVIAQ